MFEFLDDFGNYADRKVARFDVDGGASVSTARVSDGRQPFETAVSHPDYNSNKWVIVEAYDTKNEAQAGHDKWVKAMTTEPLLEELRDCANSRVEQFIDAVKGHEFVVFRRDRK